MKRKQIIDKFNKNKIYIRPVWKLNHTQKVFKKFQTYKIEKAYKLFDNSICLPSSPFLTLSEIERVINSLNE